MIPTLTFAPLPLLLLLGLLQQPQPTPLLPTRPRDPFVFRCVLDQHPRMITVALDDDMWVAWDAQTCSLYKGWKGGVKFDGPVYTTVHGPQPTSQGLEYTTAVPGDPWSAVKNGQPLACRVRYGGYRIVANRVTIEWRVRLDDGTDVTVYETPDFVRPKEMLSPEQLDDLVLGDGDEPGLQRMFEASGIPEGTQLSLTVRTDNAVLKLGMLERERFEDVKDEKGVILSTRVYSQLPLTHDQPRNAVLLIFRPVEVAPSVPVTPPSGGK